MSPWQFNAAVAGYINANTPSRGALSESEKADLFDWIDAPAALEIATNHFIYAWDGARLTASRLNPRP